MGKKGLRPGPGLKKARHTWRLADGSELDTEDGGLCVLDTTITTSAQPDPQDLKGI